MVSADDKDELKFRVNESLRRIGVWMKSHHLEIASEKTEALIMKGPRNREGVKFDINDMEILPKRAIRYLGIMLDDNGSFGTHIAQAYQKAGERAAALARLMPNIGGPGSKKREMLNGVVQSILLYGALIWHEAMRVKLYKDRMERAQRMMLLRVGSGYRTVATKALQVITGIRAIHLNEGKMEERYGVYQQGKDGDELLEIKKEERENTLNIWQSGWRENTTVGAWTKRLIPDIRRWVKCQHRRTNYSVTEALFGHGPFRTFTKRIGKTPDDRCLYCGEVDSPDHTIFECDRWATIRQVAYGDLDRELNIGNMIEIMVEDKRAWQIAEKMIIAIIKAKEEEERRAQQQQNEQ